jgi:hypothetical protein
MQWQHVRVPRALAISIVNISARRVTIGSGHGFVR